MTRTVISLLVGIALAIGALTIAALVLSHGDTNAIIPFLLYWPASVTDKLGFGDCANADLIADKLKCIRTCFLIDAIFYPLIILICSYVSHSILSRRNRRLRPSAVV
jgi:uncharacterized membrane protein